MSQPLWKGGQYVLKWKTIMVKGNVCTPLAEIEVRLLSDPYQSLFRHSCHSSENKCFVEYFSRLLQQEGTSKPFVFNGNIHFYFSVNQLIPKSKLN
jgi:hypothetical protein